MQIRNELSLRVILERLSARGLYREVYLARVFFTKKTSRYYWIPATAGFQSLEVTLHISKVLNESKAPSFQNRRGQLWIKLAVTVGSGQFVVSDLLFCIKVQSKKYKIQICNALSLRVILERLSARGLYREVYLARVFFTKKTSRYYWIPATAGFQSLEVTLHISKVLNESKTPSVQNRREGRALRKGLVDLFSEWARWRVGFGMKYFTSSKNHS